jgi:N-acetylglucosaminyldiphosphoundecaprenol N-acetyl-beta-D-mannosaminyltransferase
VFPDAYGLKWAARLLHRREIELTPGYRLMFALLEQAEALGQSVYLLGTTDEILELGRARMLEKHPRLRICGWHNGFFKPDEEAALFRQIAQLEPDFVFVAMGEYLQEKVIARLRQVYPDAICQGVGGSIDLLAGRQPKPPGWMVRHHLEWLCRQPFRLPRFKALPIFAALVIKEKLRRLFTSHGHAPSC